MTSIAAELGGRLRESSPQIRHGYMHLPSPSLGMLIPAAGFSYEYFDSRRTETRR